MAAQTKIRLAYDREALERVCRRYRITKLSFFGSVLRDDFTPESDVDVIVDFEPELEYGLAYLGHVETALGEVLARKVDLVEEGCLNPVVAEDVQGRRRLIYAAAG